MTRWSWFLGLLFLLSFGTHAAEYRDVPRAERYSALVGDLNGDGRKDIFVSYQPAIVPIQLDDISIPIPITKRRIGEFVLQQQTNGTFSLLTGLSQQQRSAALGWARSAIQIVLGDVNADANPDIIVLSVAAEIPGATDTFVFGPSQAGGAPTAVRAIDPSLAKFFRDVKGWLKNPQHYFDAAWRTETRTIPWTVNVYNCGGPSSEAYLAGTYGDLYASLYCEYLYSYTTTLTAPVQVFDTTNYSRSAYNFTSYFPPGSIGSTAEFRMNPQSSELLRSSLANLLGAPFGTPEYVNGTLQMGGFWSYLVQVAEANQHLILAAMAPPANSADPGEIWIQRATTAVEAILRNLPSPPGQGQIKVQYPRLDIIKIVAHLMRLGQEHTPPYDWSVDTAEAPDREMVARLLAQHGDRYTQAYYHHEMAEIYKVYPVGLALHGAEFLQLQNAAHYATELNQENSVYDRYAPSVVRAHYPSLFSGSIWNEVASRPDYDE
jgi:hypothetical protein